MKKRILVTGATGFVGRQVLASLAFKNVPITLVVREGAQSGIPLDYPMCKIISTEDLFSETSEWWTDALKDVDTLIHIAWYAEPSKYLMSVKNLDCLIGTLNIAKGAINAGVRRFIGIGTCFEYDCTAGWLHSNTPLKPLTPYASSKAAAYMVLAQMLPSHDIEFLWCRLFYLYGEGEDSRRFVPYLRERLSSGQFAELTDGSQIRDFLNVSEAGRMIVEASLGSSQGAMNICSGFPTTIKDFSEIIADEYGRRDLLKFGLRAMNSFDPPCVVGVR